MFTLRRSLLLISLVLAMILAVACQPQEVVREVEVPVEVTRIITETVTEGGETVEVTRIVSEQIVVTATPEPSSGAQRPVTLHVNLGSEPPSLDPSLATDTTSVTVIRNIFVGLTQFDSETGEVIPYLATDWEDGEDANGNQTWTFNLRDDIAWVNYNPLTGETSQVMDDDGNPRFVNAHDVVYGLRRTLDPATGSDYAYVLYIIQNAQDANEGSEEVTLDDVGVTALDDWTVQFTLETPAGFFPAIAGMWVAHPLPEWAIEENPNKWTEAGLMVSNGPYVLETWIHGGELVLVKNPLWINADQVQIERVEAAMIVEESTAFALYENNELDTAAVPSPELDRVRADAQLSQQYVSQPDPCTYYYGFTNTKAPFDDARVRQAFSESIDRQSLIDNVLKAGQTPASSFAPPGIFGAPEPGTVGVNYDPDSARAALQSYLDEQNMTLAQFNAQGILLMYNTSEAHARIAAAIQQMWKDTLDVEVRVENQEWRVYLQTIRPNTPIEQAPHIWRLGWCADYPDENNWVHEVFNATAGANNLRRNCVDANCGEVTASEFDDLTAQAARSGDPDERAELYAEAEHILAAVEYAYAPIYHYTLSNVAKPWLSRNYPALGGDDYFNWTIDMDAKAAAQGR
jgi:oligopeptide transport system substrate-binding protein